MKLCQIYCGVFGAWGWEHLSTDGSVDESREVFESFEECVQDARRHGYMPVRPLYARRPDADSYLFDLV